MPMPIRTIPISREQTKRAFSSSGIDVLNGISRKTPLRQQERGTQGDERFSGGWTVVPEHGRNPKLVHLVNEHHDVVTENLRQRLVDLGRLGLAAERVANLNSISCNFYCSPMAKAGRPKARVQGRPFHFKLPLVTLEYLQALISTGTYGTSERDAVLMLIHDAIERLIAEKKLRRRPSDEAL